MICVQSGIGEVKHILLDGRLLTPTDLRRLIALEAVALAYRKAVQEIDGIQEAEAALFETLKEGGK